MHRIDTPTAQKDKFGQGKNGFTNGDPTTGTPSTHLNSDIFDALQEEPCTVIEKSGIKLDKNRHDQLYHAIKKLAGDAVDKAKAELIEALRQKLTKNENGADIPDKNLFVKNLGLTETVDCAKNALDKRTGGIVKGEIISQGGQISLKGDKRQHLGFHNQDGSVRMWIWKDKGGDGVRLNNGDDGGGEYVFHKDGGFRAPSSMYAGAAKIAADGNIYGSQWGNQGLDVYLRNTFQPKGNFTPAGQAYSKVESDARYVRDVQRGVVSAIYTPEGTSTDAPKGCVMVGVTLSSDGSSGTHVYQILYCPLQIKINGAWRTISDISDSE